MLRDLIILGLCCLTFGVIGAIIATVRSRNWKGDFYTSCEDSAQLLVERDFWRQEANTNARELQRVRAQMQKRDPKSGRMLPKHEIAASRPQVGY